MYIASLESDLRAGGALFLQSNGTLASGAKSLARFDTGLEAYAAMEKAAKETGLCSRIVVTRFL